jgi:hypothetical protein
MIKHDQMWPAVDLPLRHTKRDDVRMLDVHLREVTLM